MMQIKKKLWHRRPGFDTGDILHVSVNTIFVVCIYAAVQLWSLLPIAIVLVLLSKWRILAVQPRFWLPNIRTNMVDIVVGISTVVLMDQTDYVLFGAIMAALYLAWLLLLKPQTHETWVGVQSLWSQFTGMTALFAVVPIINFQLGVVVLSWLIAWSSARHYFGNYEEPNYRPLGLTWGFFMAQLAWVQLHWVQYYTVFDLKIATFAIISLILSIGLGSVYHSYKNNRLNKSVIMENCLFTGILLAVIIVLSNWSAGI